MERLQVKLCKQYIKFAFERLCIVNGISRLHKTYESEELYVQLIWRKV